MFNFNSDWKVSSTGTTLEFRLKDYKVVVNQQEDFYDLSVLVYHNDKYPSEKNFLTLNEALVFVKQVVGGDVDYA